MANTHDHSHHDHHHHHNERVDYSKAFLIGIILNLSFVLIESGYGYYSNSLALIADAGHNLSDVLGLVLAWAAIWLGKKKPSNKFTYGLGYSSILAALINAILLLIAVGAICWEAIGRFGSPEKISSVTIISVASVGIVINGITALLFMSGRKSDLNIRGAYLHMAADALISVGVVIAGIVMRFTDWAWIDPLVSIAIGFVIVYSTWGLLRDSFVLALGAVPDGIELEKLKNYLRSIKDVSSFHDLHVWAMSTKENALTVHLMMPNGHPGDALLSEISNELNHHFKIHHSTIQIELGDTSTSCRLEPDEVI